MVKQLFVVGPTASGKSALALILAQRCGGVLCSMDAFQVYRLMNIGTGKPTVSEQSLAPHYLLDLRDPLSPFSVADYLQESESVLASLPEQTPQVWVGGAGLYLRALRQGLTMAPESKPELVERLSTWPLAALQEKIRELDPEWCVTADMQNPRRLIRALAVVMDTGKPLSVWHEERSKPLIDKRVRGVFLLPEREQLRKLIATRVQHMWELGWPDEVKSLLAIEGWREAQSAKALGYLLIADYLQGKLGKDECRQKIVTLTCQYAKRQETWFRSEPGMVLISYQGAASRLAENLLHEWDL